MHCMVPTVEYGDGADDGEEPSIIIIMTKNKYKNDNINIYNMIQNMYRNIIQSSSSTIVLLVTTALAVLLSMFAIGMQWTIAGWGLVGTTRLEFIVTI